MPLIGDLTLFAPNTDALAAEVNANFAAVRTVFNNSAVLVDVPRTINVRHTYAGGLTVSGGTLAVTAPAEFSALTRFARAAGTELVAGRTTGESNDRWSLRANGRVARGPGNAAWDLYEVRSGAGWFRVTNMADGSEATAGGIDVFGVRARGHVDADGYLRSSRPIASDYGVQVRVDGNIEPQLVIRAGGEIGWGDGTTAPTDVRLWRSSAGQLTLQGALRITGRLTAQSGMFNAGDSGSSKVINWANGAVQTVRMTANCTFTFQNANPGDVLTLHMVQDGTGGRTATLTGWTFEETPTYNTGAAKENVVTALVTVQGVRAARSWSSPS